LACGLAWLCAACAAGSQPVSTSLPPLASSTPYVIPTAAPTVPVPAHILSLIPACQEIETLDEPVALIWPNAEQRLDELSDSRWGYYRCPQAPVDVSAFYHDKMTEPPYNMRQVAWVNIPQGTLGLYFHSAYHLWTYLWVLPPEADAPGAYVLVAQTDAMAFEPDC
jgi:hypothetical protein